jgi:hypothetical protein
VAADLDCEPLYGRLPDGGIAPTFEQVFMRTFEPTCGISGCHALPNPRGGLRLDDADAAHASLLAAGNGNARVVPGDLRRGKFLVRLETHGESWSMPPGHPLDAPTLCTLRHWVANGAPR